jgi:hypothetical protein
MLGETGGDGGFKPVWRWNGLVGHGCHSFKMEKDSPPFDAIDWLEKTVEAKSERLWSYRHFAVKPLVRSEIFVDLDNAYEQCCTFVFSCEVRSELGAH